MKRNLKGLLLGAALTAFVFPTAAFAQGGTKAARLISQNSIIKFCGTSLDCSGESISLNGQTVYPIRVLGAILGGTVQWNPGSNSIICTPNQPVKPETPETTPEVPENTPEVPEVTPDVPEVTPEVTPEVPESTPNVPENTPEVPENTPNVPEETPDKPGTDVSEFAVRVFDLTNQERINAGLEPFKWSDDLAAVAYAHSADMAARNFFSHNNPDGQTPFDRMRAYGISYTYAAENIAMGQRTPEAVVSGWMNSAGHRANILNPNLTHLGVGFYQTSGGTNYWTQNFCTPR